MTLRLQKNDIILFQGDSITDAGRDYSDGYNLGVGYPLMIAAALSHRYPEQQLQFLNRGISGHRVKDLKARWQTDCLDLQPTIVSICIGINDTWRRYDQNDPTSVEAFEANYRELLTQTRDKLDARIILLEPFLLPYPEERWREDLDPKINVVRKLALEFNASLVPLDGLFAQACTRAVPKYWAGDGIHPTSAGHALITDAWLQAVDLC